MFLRRKRFLLKFRRGEWGEIPNFYIYTKNFRKKKNKKILISLQPFMIIYVYISRMGYKNIYFSKSLTMLNIYCILHIATQCSIVLRLESGNMSTDQKSGSSYQIDDEVSPIGRK